MPYIEELNAGMPALDESAGTTSWFEFAPPKIFYAPIAFYSLYLSLRHLGVTLPTCTNPALPFSGLVGESKFEVLNAFDKEASDYLPTYAQVRKSNDDTNNQETMSKALQQKNANKLEYPFVVKPDIGMRGAGVRVVKSDEELENYIKAFPGGADILLQALVNEEGEAGVFYIRHPGDEVGSITSLTLKYFPKVIGDGSKTLRELIMADSRASQIAHVYFERHEDYLDEVVEEGRTIRLAFAGSHSRGTIFRNGNDHITPEMVKTFDKLAKQMGEFYIGRFDIRFSDFDALKDGKGFQIIEVNGAGGEPTHIWDSRTKLFEAYSALMQQYKSLYQIGSFNRSRGFKPDSPISLFKAWMREKRLTERYPFNH
ncbi:ATP-grasp domain-containing protein [Kordiimonas sp. SCSIO 12610]|uniref:ATP-binding protein n=1 Tax=Kordiimonas sp. SCSIO 12610 TaxID=2829597 RepID=UPI00210DAF50|nr:ATP-grasp domain-containing protein [Kordiimonas sp. SCSIO 12610]UTW54631.1 ATP-grasp domain-containing protein [Kordiimonas sp. SCSIO 12610]